jgi:uncharacterized protein YkwD
LWDLGKWSIVWLMNGVLGRGLLAFTLILGATGCGTTFSGARGQDLTVAEQNEPLSWEGFDPVRLSRSIFEETNRVRRTFNRKALKHNQRLDAAADLQSDTNALTGVTSHGNPMVGLARPSDRVLASGLRPIAVWENAAATLVRRSSQGWKIRITVEPDGSRVRRDPVTGEEVPWPTYQKLAERIVQQYMGSPGHRENILLRDATHLGCGASLSRGPLGAEVLNSTQVFIQLRSR